MEWLVQKREQMARRRPVLIRLVAACMLVVVALQRAGLVDVVAGQPPPPPPHAGTVRIIQSPDGDIVDCVLRHRQPAFDHPLLKNHTIQNFPTNLPSGFLTSQEQRIEESSSYPKLQVWHQNESCPLDTIPILRQPTSVKKTKILHRTRSEGNISHQSTSIPKERVLLSPNSNPQNHEHAIVQLDNGPIYGAHSTLNVWNPILQNQNEMSLAQMWLLAGQFEGTDLNSIEVGWQVNPALHGGDRRARFFIYWTSDFYTRTGCYDLKCPGFVQVSSKFLLGGVISPVSTYDGNQFELGPLLIWKDIKTRNWWLYYNKIFLGYWPSILFTHLAEHADTLEWGGEVINLDTNGHHTSTQMGSGHFSKEGFGKSCFAHSLKGVDSNNKLFRVHVDDLNLGISRPECYDLQTASYDDWGTTIFFGGPGQNPRCP